MKNLKLLAVGAVLAAAAIPAAAQDKARQIAEIRIVGNQLVGSADVLSRLDTKVGQLFDPAVAEKDKARLMGTGMFRSVEITKVQQTDGVQVIVRVEEQVRVGNINFLRNRAFSRGDLVKELPFSTDAVLNDATVMAGRQAIINKYKSAGYDFIKVEAKPISPTQVVYEIVEGPQVSVSGVRFAGNMYFSTFTLRRKVETAARWWPFIEGRLNIEQVDRDVHVVRNTYVDEGFLDALVSYRLDFTADKSQAVVTFNINEGRRYRVRNLRFEGQVLFNESQLLSGMKLAHGGFYTAEFTKADMKRIQEKYGSAGYVEAQISPTRLYVKDTPGLVDLVLKIREGGSYKVGDVRIKGSSVTHEDKIRNVLKPLPGQVLDAAALERARQRLSEMGLFEDVKTSIYGKGAATRDILVEVKEAATAQFMIGAGISSRDGLLGNVSFRQRNFNLFGWPSSWNDMFGGRGFKGEGQTLSVVAEPGTKLMRFSTEWFDPAINNTDYSLGVKLAYFERKRESYDERRASFPIATVGRRWANSWGTEFALRVENVNVASVASDAPSEVVADAGSHTLVGAKVAGVHDTRNSRYLPSEGDIFRLSYEQVVGTDTFGHVDGSYAFYNTLYTDALGRKHVLATRASAGYIVGDAPVFERYYGGGIGSLRGFRYRGISPRSAGTDEPIGGEFMLYAGAEYTFPIFGTEGQQLRGVWFVDSGTVEEDPTITAYRISAGFGLRWTMPLFGPVPMSFDFGFPVSKDPQDKTQIFSFSLGWSF
ncbi:MAG: outer membrane protein assembly factor BamA [Planctomycetota bacterium]|nr:outer membrane protein assembly factor BamA [Planctomycetota bacterium]